MFIHSSRPLSTVYSRLYRKVVTAVQKRPIIAFVLLLLAGAALVVLLLSHYGLAPMEPSMPDLSSPYGQSLGMVLIDIQSEETAAYFHVSQLGVYVLAVDESSAAYAAGLRSGDRITAFNGAQVSGTADINDQAPTGDSLEAVQITIQRYAPVPALMTLTVQPHADP